MLHSASSLSPHIDDTAHTLPGDAVCLADVADVLRKHGMLGRFGVFLNHHHFNVDDDEVLVETSDYKSRVTSIKPMKISEADKHPYVETTWLFDETGSQRCSLICRGTNNGATHDEKHV